MDTRLISGSRLVESAAAGLADITRGVEHPRLETAKTRLREAGIALTSSGGLSAWARTWIIALVVGAGVWVTATVAAEVIVLPSGWVITATAIAFLILVVLAYQWNESLDADQVRGLDEAPGEAAPSSLVEVIWILEQARDEISEAIRRRITAHRFGSAARTATGFDWLRGIDPYLFRLSVADRCVCQAIDSIGIWRDIQDVPTAREADS